LSRITSTILVLSVAVALACSAAEPQETVPEHQDLLTGYDLLADVLSDESQLGALLLLKRLTLRAPVPEVAEIAKELAAASKQRSAQLEELRTLEPDVSGEPAVRSPLGDAITAIAKEAGTDELLDRDLAFSLRFVLLQAQATRMVSAMATATAEADPNATRRAWLGEVAAEYEGYREEIIALLALYLRGEGAAQTDGDA
jgi:hypothetical protein